MKTRLHLAGSSDLPRLMPMVAAFHTEEGIDLDPARREAALAPLLEGSPHGAAYLVGPRNAPVGYVIVCFSWSVEFGGIDGMVDEIWIRPAVRGRGMGGEALRALAAALRDAGVVALSLEVDRESAARRFYARIGFEARERYMLMSMDL